MRAVAIKSFGGPDVMRVMDLAPPEPRAGEALVNVRFAGVNRIDVYLREGDHVRGNARPVMPRLLGREGAGEVIATGAGVTMVKPGDRVAWCVTDGSYAEVCAVPAWRLWKVPHDMPLDIACALQLPGATAHYLTSSTFPLRAGDTALVHSASGTVGQLLTQIAKARGARVIATVGSEASTALATSRGADHVIVREKVDFSERVRELTGTGCEVVYDGVGRATIAASVAACRRRGVVALYGGLSGSVDSIDPMSLAEAGSVFVTRPHITDYMQSAEEVTARADDIAALWRSGRIKLDIFRILPLDGVREAHALIEDGVARGKILLKPRA